MAHKERSILDIFPVGNVITSIYNTYCIHDSIYRGSHSDWSVKVACDVDEGRTHTEI